MSRITFKEYVDAVNKFAKENPECLSLEVVSERNQGYHGVYTDKPIDKGVLQKNGFYMDGVDFFDEDEPQENFVPDIVCVGIV